MGEEETKDGAHQVHGVGCCGGPVVGRYRNATGFLYHSKQNRRNRDGLTVHTVPGSEVVTVHARLRVSRT
jgi:hypothetical protein